MNRDSVIKQVNAVGATDMLSMLPLHGISNLEVNKLSRILKTMVHTFFPIMQLIISLYHIIHAKINKTS